MQYEIGQYIPGNSLLHRAEARLKLAVLFVLLAVLALTDSVEGYAAVTVIIAIAVFLAGKKLYPAALAPFKLWKFLVIIFIMNAFFFNEGEIYWKWWIFTLSSKGISQGARVAVNVILMTAAANLLMMTTKPLKLISAIEWYLSPLRLIGVPTGDIAMILGIAIRFIPVLLAEAESIRLAQTARGADFSSKGIINRAAALMPLVIPIFIAAFRRADELALAMEARGYRSTKL